MRKYFSSDPTVCHGKVVFRGTRIPVSLILHMLEGGDSIKDILRGYPSLTKSAIQAALHLAGEMIDSESFRSRASRAA